MSWQTDATETASMEVDGNVMGANWNGHANPKTATGINLLRLLNLNSKNMATVIVENYRILINKTVDVAGFAIRLITADLLTFNDKAKFMKAGTDTKQLSLIYASVNKRDDLSGLIYAWEGSNNLIIKLVLDNNVQQVVQQSEVTMPKKSPLTPAGKKLLQILKKSSENMSSIFGLHFETLTDKTVDVIGFATRLIDAGLLTIEDNKIVMEFSTDQEQNDYLYPIAMKHEDWERLIYAWEGSNNHIIDMLIGYYESHLC